MFTIHPERWHDTLVPWMKELVWQNVKNVVKRMVVGRDQVSGVRVQRWKSVMSR